MNQKQLGPEPQTALTPMPFGGGRVGGGEQVHSSIASPASGSAASPSPAARSGMAQSVSSPGTYIQIPVNAEVRCVSAFSLPVAVQQKIFGGTRNLPKGGDCTKPTTAIYICPVNPVKVIEAKRLLPLVPKPLSLSRGAKGGTDPVQETPSTSPAAKVLSKEPSSRRQDTKMNGAGKEATIAPTPVSVKFCNNLASQVLKTFVKQQAKGANMDSLMKAYSSSPLDTKAGSSFKENALLLYNGQLYFLAQKGIEIPTGADKGKPPLRASGSHETIVLDEPESVEQSQSLGEPGPVELNWSLSEPGGVEPSRSLGEPGGVEPSQNISKPGGVEPSRSLGEPGQVEPSQGLGKPGGVELNQNLGKPGQVEPSQSLGEPGGIETSETLLSTSTTRQDAGSPKMSNEFDKKGEECDVKKDDCLNDPSGMGIGAHDMSLHPVENGLDLAQQAVKQLPNTLPGSCARGPPFSEDRDLLLKAGIYAETRVHLYRISLTGIADTAGFRLERPVKYIPQSSKKPDLVDLEECPELCREPGPVELEEYPELIREQDPTELEECPELFKEAGLADLEECPGVLTVPGPVAAKECPKLSKELGPVVKEECAAISRVLSPAELEGCPAIPREPSPLALEDCHDYSKKRVSIASEEDVAAYRVPSPTELGEYSEPPVNSSSTHLVDCLSESEEGYHSKYRRKRKEAEVELETSGGLTPAWTDQSVTAKRTKHHEDDTYSQTSADSQMETCGDLDIGSLETVDTENSVPALLPCLTASSLLELNSLAAGEESSAPPSPHKPHPLELEIPAGFTSADPLELDETVRDEKINRLKEVLKEKQAALDKMRKRISISNATSDSATLESIIL
uniref:uro-adherence factor A-like n=1 Tax=Pristiophorus japonicus TaxID=55135 RepID=UPI00398F5A0E